MLQKDVDVPDILGWCVRCKDYLGYELCGRLGVSDACGGVFVGKLSAGDVNVEVTGVCSSK